MTSRHHFALARLIALAAGSPPAQVRGVDHVILSHDRHQSSAENYAAALAYLALVACFLAAFIPLWAAIPLSFIAIHLPIFVVGLPFNNGRAVAAGYMLCGAAMAWYLALQPRWIRFAGYAIVVLVALNAVAWAIMWLLRRRIA